MQLTPGKSGWLQSAIQRDYFKGMTDLQAAFASGFLNLNHGSNLINMVPMADHQSPATYLHRSVNSVTITVPPGTKGFQFILTPTFNIVGLIRFAGDALWQAIEDQSMITGANYTSATWIKDIVKGYGSRILARAATIENDTAALYQSGKIYCGKIGSNMDYTSFSESSPITNGANMTTIQRVPVTTPQLQRGVSSYQEFNARDGCYIVAKTSNLDMNYRSKPWDKVIAWTPLSAMSDLNTCNTIRVTDSANTLSQVTAPIDPANLLPYGANVARYVPVDPRMSGLDTTTCIFQGLNASAEASSSFTIRISTAYEIDLHVDSPLIASKTVRPSSTEVGTEFINAVLAYSNLQLGMYTADANFWDKVWTGFKKFWDFSKPIRNVLPNMLPPQYRGIADKADTIIQQLVDQ